MTVAWVKLELDLATFDPKPWDSLLDSIDATGITMSTLAELGATEQHLRKMYELNAVCSADIPGRGTFHTWEEYRRLRIDMGSRSSSASALKFKIFRVKASSRNG